MAFTSLGKKRVRLADQVYEQIIQAIKDGTITPDDRIVQENLAEEFEISRTPVREALFRMEQEGILVLAKRGGFRIRKIDRDEIIELYGIRAAIEGYAARLLAEKNDPEINAGLRKLIHEKENLKVKTVEAYFDANLAIHRAFVLATENRFILEFFDNIWNRGSSYTLFATLEDALEKSLGEHMSLVDAIETGDGTIAAETMIMHIRKGRELQIGQQPK